MGLVPKKTDHIYTNFEKMKYQYPQRELGNLQRLTKKSVATQTIDFTKVNYQNSSILFRVKFYCCCYIYLSISLKRSVNIWNRRWRRTNSSDLRGSGTTTKMRAQTKTPVFAPLNAQNRVTDKVF